MKGNFGITQMVQTTMFTKHKFGTKDPKLRAKRHKRVGTVTRAYTVFKWQRYKYQMMRFMSLYLNHFNESRWEQNSIILYPYLFLTDISSLIKCIWIHLLPESHLVEKRRANGHSLVFYILVFAFSHERKRWTYRIHFSVCIYFTRRSFYPV